ncbi:MAG: trehalose-6-phosphate synthase, partial [Chitinophagaceae bacterium]|nr:trehalose-6-phosphate synthase [Chitinophagaceae bacterium]
EYIAVQGEVKGDKGVLVLSEFAGAAVELPYAVLTNPYDPKALRENLLQALLMNSEERNIRMERLYELINHYDINYWAEDFLAQATVAQEKAIITDMEQVSSTIVEEAAV